MPRFKDFTKALAEPVVAQGKRDFQSPRHWKLKYHNVRTFHSHLRGMLAFTSHSLDPFWILVEATGADFLRQGWRLFPAENTGLDSFGRLETRHVCQTWAHKRVYCRTLFLFAVSSPYFVKANKDNNFVGSRVKFTFWKHVLGAPSSTTKFWCPLTLDVIDVWLQCGQGHWCRCSSRHSFRDCRLFQSLEMSKSFEELRFKMTWTFPGLEEATMAKPKRN